MLTAKAAPTLLVMMGSIDLLTTIVGITYFGAIESNPFIASLANTNLPAFTVMKLGAAFLVAFLFYQIEKTLSKAKEEKNSKVRFYLLRTFQAASLVVLMGAAINNISIIISSAD